MLPAKFDLEYYRNVLIRRRWYVIVPFLLTLCAATVYTVVTPRLYRASTLILIQRQTIPEQYVKTTVTADIQDRIKTIRHEVTSRTNLEALITMFGLYESEDPSEKEMLMEEKVELMNRDIEAKVHRNAAFSISFVYPDAVKVTQVTNALTDNFIKKNLEVREAQSTGTTKFLESELALLQAVLDEKDAKLTAFKQEHMGSLPGQLDTNINLSRQLNAQIVSIERSLDEAQNQKIMIQGQLSNMQNMAGALSFDEANSVAPIEESQLSPEVANLQQRLETLRLRYTENHPDVVKLKRLIAKMEKEHEELPVEKGDSLSVNVGSSGGDIFGSQIKSLKLQLDTIEKNILNLNTEKDQLKQQMSRVSQRIENAPRAELELIALKRDYDTTQRQYDSLLAKKLEAQLAANMEMRQKGEQFLIVDSAKIPEKPFKPNILKILLLGILAGLAAGLGLALGLEYIDDTFRDYNELKDFLQLPLMAVIPRLQTSAEVKKLQRRRKIFAFSVGGSILIGIGIGLWLWMNGNL